MSNTNSIDFTNYSSIVFFTGAGISAESGVPTYHGKDGIWEKYNWNEVACQEAFDNDPEKVLKFHEMRKQNLIKCQPNKGHLLIASLQKQQPNVHVITQNIDGLHQRAGAENVIELHGSIWRLRCDNEEKIIENKNEKVKSYKCNCGNWLRPDIVWFGDMLDESVINTAKSALINCNLFVSIGTSGIVWPAAGFPQIAKNYGAECIEINTEPTEVSNLFDKTYRGSASEILPKLFFSE